MPTPPSDRSAESPIAEWAHAGRSIQSFAHDVNNHLGAVLAYAELISADAGSSAEARRMASEIMSAARESASRLDTLATLVSGDLATVDTIHLNALVPNLSSLFRVELEKGGSGLDISIPQTVCAFAGVRARIVRALVHTLRHAADRALSVMPSGNVALRLTRESDRFRVEIAGPGPASESGDRVFPDALVVAQEHLRYHGGELKWSATGVAQLEVPLETSLNKQAAAP